MVWLWTVQRGQSSDVTRGRSCSQGERALSAPPASCAPCGIPKRPLHHSPAGRIHEAPLPLRDDAPDVAGERPAIGVADGSRFEDRKDRQRALDATVRALRISVMKMRTHDPERQVLLDALVEL
jgi:hypothetical protein